MMNHLRNMFGATIKAVNNYNLNASLGLKQQRLHLNMYRLPTLYRHERTRGQVGETEEGKKCTESA